METEIKKKTESEKTKDKAEIMKKYIERFLTRKVPRLLATRKGKEGVFPKAARRNEALQPPLQSTRTPHPAPPRESVQVHAHQSPVNLSQGLSPYQNHRPRGFRRSSSLQDSVQLVCGGEKDEENGHDFQEPNQALEHRKESSL